MFSLFSESIDKYFLICGIDFGGVICEYLTKEINRISKVVADNCAIGREFIAGGCATKIEKDEEKEKLSKIDFGVSNKLLDEKISKFKE